MNVENFLEQFQLSGIDAPILDDVQSEQNEDGAKCECGGDCDCHCDGSNCNCS